jgi:hypothetical protein
MRTIPVTFANQKARPKLRQQTNRHKGIMRNLNLFTICAAAAASFSLSAQDGTTVNPPIVAIRQSYVAPDLDGLESSHTQNNHETNLARRFSYWERHSQKSGTFLVTAAYSPEPGFVCYIAQDLDHNEEIEFCDDPATREAPIILKIDAIYGLFFDDENMISSFSTSLPISEIGALQ